MNKVLLRFYSANNLGDDLFIKIITERYKNRFTTVGTSVNVFLGSISNLRVHNNKVIYLALRILGKVLGKNNLYLQLLQAKNDLMVYAGGSIFIEGNNLKMWQKERAFYQNSRIPHYILGANVGPYKHGYFLTILKDIFKTAEDVCFRDHASYNLFNDLDTTRVASDIVFSLDPSKYELKNEKTAIFSIINCSSRFDENISAKYDQEIANMTRQLVKDGYKVIYMSFCKHEGDEIANERIMSSLDQDIAEKVEPFNYNGNLEEALSLIARCDIVVGARFHAVILGLLFSKKVLPMAYSKKTTNILDDVGFKGDIVDINNIDAFNGSTFDFSSLQVNNIDKQIQLAELQFQELDKVLVKRR